MSPITLVIPVFNEVGNLMNLGKLLVEFQKRNPQVHKVLFINDGSTDDSELEIEKFCRRHDFFEHITLPTNEGLSRALKTGFDSVTTPWTGYMDSDLQILPEDFEKLFPFMNEYHLISGYRKQRQDSLIRKLSSTVANGFRRLITGDGMKDSGCPLKLIRTDFARQIPFFEGMHRFLPALIQMQGGKIIEITISHYPRVSGKSKFGIRNRLRAGIQATTTFIRIRKNYKKSIN